MWRLPSSADLLSHEGRGLKVGLVFWEHEGEEAEEDSSVRISVILRIGLCHLRFILSISSL